MSFWEKLTQFLSENWKTTVAGFVAALAAFLAEYGIDLSDAAQGQLMTWILAGGLFFIGMFSKDGDKPDNKE